MLNDGGREKDVIFQALMESEGGQDRAAAINTPVIKVWNASTVSDTRACMHWC